MSLVVPDCVSVDSVPYAYVGVHSIESACSIVVVASLTGSFLELEGIPANSDGCV